VVVGFGLFFALLAQINKMVEVDLAENNILVVCFTFHIPEEKTNNKFGSKNSELAYRIKQEIKENSGKA
jgi:hypothetical protein